ncbi:hypothetical protein CR203_07205 [Salipaludibacillus neizhouensis]|uniref:PucR family transcriptional regulator n=1 Tax=Salipaludibacillus neizhouensis TaxID=885475 RepID=A0A3A9K8E3_9BACI|nr:helix-turn-helix domain-containing protein [Salipaludibacillus neizhouensis]RKL68469.1 hypothetical protein CR203_07205 [Salipaludibacillus neizhouensis]
MKIHAIEEHSRRLKNEFFTDLMEVVSPEEILNRGREYKLDKKLHYICISCKMDAASDFHLYPAPMQTEREISHQRDRIYELLESLLGSQFENSILFTKGDLFIILLGFEFYDEMMEQKVQETIAAIQLDIFQTLNSSLSFGISNYKETVTDLPTVFHEAVDALRSGYRENTKRFIKNYRIKELTELFKTIPLQKLKEFYKSSLKELAYPQDKEKEDLVNTLTSYLNNNCQISDTAKEMYIHRNTVIYRMKKCEKLMGTDFKKDDETLRLRIALFIGSLMENKATK